MMFLVRSEIDRSMMSATAMMEAARRNQIGQPADCSIANNLFPYSYCERARNVRQRRAREQLTRCSNRDDYVVLALHAVVHIAISTKTCGQVCGLTMDTACSPRHSGPQDGRDQKLSTALHFENMRLRRRIGVRAL